MVERGYKHKKAWQSRFRRTAVLRAIHGRAATLRAAPKKAVLCIVVFQ